MLSWATVEPRNRMLAFLWSHFTKRIDLEREKIDVESDLAFLWSCFECLAVAFLFSEILSSANSHQGS